MRITRLKPTERETETFEVIGAVRTLHDGTKERLMVDLVHPDDDTHEAFLYYPSESLKLRIYSGREPRDKAIAAIFRILENGGVVEEYATEHCFY